MTAAVTVAVAGVVLVPHFVCVAFSSNEQSFRGYRLFRVSLDVFLVLLQRCSSIGFPSVFPVNHLCVHVASFPSTAYDFLIAQHSISTMARFAASARPSD